jgi:hypothetical protein
MGLKELVTFVLGSNAPGAIEERRLLREQLDAQAEEMARVMDPAPEPVSAAQCPGCAQPWGPRETWCRFCGRERAPQPE